MVIKSDLSIYWFVCLNFEWRANREKSNTTLWFSLRCFWSSKGRQMRHHVRHEPSGVGQLTWGRFLRLCLIWKTSTRRDPYACPCSIRPSVRHLKRDNCALPKLSIELAIKERGYFFVVKWVWLFCNCWYNQRKACLLCLWTITNVASSKCKSKKSRTRLNGQSTKTHL